MSEVIDYEYWSDFLFREGAVCTPAELHGLVCGLRCVGGEQWQASIYTVLDVPMDEASEALREAVSAFYDVVKRELTSDEYSLKLMMPDDALPVQTRSNALADWSRGFLFGFASLGKPVAEKLDQEGQEAIRDIAKITELDPEMKEGEESEAAYTELVEYVRIVAITLYEQLNPNLTSDLEQLH